MRRLRFLAFAMMTAVSPIAFVTTSGAADRVANAQAPSPGDSCTALNTTTQDAYGRTMWCNPTLTGNHNLVWQYGGPS
jgi:hypothetical protein